MYLFPFQVKCDHYWPFTEDPIAYGDITVEMLSEEEHTDWVYRNFRISYVSLTFCMALLKEWEWFQSTLFFNFCPFLAFSGKCLRERLMPLPSFHTGKWVNHKTFSWLSEFLSKVQVWMKSSTRVLYISVVPIVSDNKCVNFFISGISSCYKPFKTWKYQCRN